MPWNQRSHFYCEVASARQEIEKICSNAHRGLHIVAAGELGAIELHLIAHDPKVTETIGPRGGRKISVRRNDVFEVWYRPWESSDSPKAPAILIAAGPLDYDRLNHEEGMVRLNDQVVETYRAFRAMEVMKE